MLRKLMNKIFGNSIRTRRRPTRCSEHLEDRVLLTSNLNFVAAQQRIVLGGGAEVNNYTVAFDGTNYIITDTSGAAVNPIGIVDLDGAANSVTFDPAALTFNRFEINGNAGDDTLDINSFRAGAEGITVFNDAGEGADTINVNADIGSAGSRVSGNQVVLRAETVNLGASIFTSNLAATVEGVNALNLTTDATIDAGSGTVTVQGPVDGAQTLTLLGGTVIVSGTVGGVTPVTGLVATGSTSVTTNDVTATGAITIQTDNYIPLGTLNGSGTADLTISRNTAGTQSFNADSFPFVAPGFNSVTIGSALTTTLTITSDGDNNPGTGAFGFDADLTLIGGTISLNDHLNQGTHSLTLRADTTLNFNGITGATGTGTVNIEKLNAGGTLTVNGKLGVPTSPNFWGAAPLVISGPGSTVTFTNGVGSAFASINATADTLNFNHSSALTAQGDITLTGNVNLNGGITSFNGNVIVLGSLNLTGNTLFKAGVGGIIGVQNDVTANGFNMLFRGNGGALGFVQINGDVIGAGQFRVDSSGASTADQIILNDVSATDIVLRAATLTHFFGDITSSGSINIVGPVFLTAPGPNATVNITNGGLATHLMQFSGTINGGNTLNINSGLARTTFTGAIGGTDPLANLTVNSGGLNTITQPITVTGDVIWTVGTDGNGLNDRITRSGAGSVNAGGNITLIADVISGTTVGVNVNAGGMATITQRGAGN